MTALIIVDLTPIDSEQLSQYSALAAKTLLGYQGEFIAKAPIEVLHGNSTHKVKVVIQFPDREKAESWYNSEEYQKIIPIRDKGMNSQFHLVG
jgi:uncharacterized protein (DUF1330 family)